MLVFTPGKSVFGRDMLFNTTPIVDWHIIFAKKQQRVKIDDSL